MGFKKYRPLNDIDDGFYELTRDKVFDNGDVIEAGTLVRIRHSCNYIKCFYNFSADTRWTDDCEYYLISSTNERGDFRAEDTNLLRKTNNIAKFEEEYLRAENKDYSVMNNARHKCDKRNYAIMTDICEDIGDIGITIALTVAITALIGFITGIFGAVLSKSFLTGVASGAAVMAILCALAIPVLVAIKNYNEKSKTLRETAKNYTVNRDMVMNLLYDSEHGVLRTDIIEKEAKVKEIGQLGRIQDYCKLIHVGPLELFKTQFDMFNEADVENSRTVEH